MFSSPKLEKCALETCNSKQWQVKYYDGGEADPCYGPKSKYCYDHKCNYSMECLKKATSPERLYCKLHAKCQPDQERSICSSHGLPLVNGRMCRYLVDHLDIRSKPDDTLGKVCSIDKCSHRIYHYQCQYCPHHRCLFTRCSSRKTTKWYCDYHSRCEIVENRCQSHEFELDEGEKLCLFAQLKIFTKFSALVNQC